MHEWSFADEIRLDPIRLPRAALYFARAIAYPELDINKWLVELKRLAKTARTYIRRGTGSLEKGTLLAEFLFQHCGYRGNSAQYMDPRNSFLNEVLDRRLGIPITLSAVYVAVARGLDIAAAGVGLPGHFIVRLSEDSESWYLDPFHGGRRLSETECAQLVELSTGYTGAFEPRWLDPTPPLEILARMLNNLRAAYVSSEQWDKAALTIEHLRMVQPASPEHIRDLGLVHYRKDSPRLAAQYLDHYLQQAPQAGDAETIRSGVSEALDRWARQN
jgi:regulator of sirC expression with transglutaminase-like and TPR domain